MIASPHSGSIMEVASDPRRFSQVKQKTLLIVFGIDSLPYRKEEGGKRKEERGKRREVRGEK